MIFRSGVVKDAATLKKFRTSVASSEYALSILNKAILDRDKSNTLQTDPLNEIRKKCQEDANEDAEAAKDLVQKLLQVIPSQRINADQAIHHKWVAKFYNPAGKYDFTSHFQAPNYFCLQIALLKLQLRNGSAVEMFFPLWTTINNFPLMNIAKNYTKLFNLIKPDDIITVFENYSKTLVSEGFNQTLCKKVIVFIFNFPSSSFVVLLFFQQIKKEAWISLHFFRVFFGRCLVFGLIIFALFWQFPFCWMSVSRSISASEVFKSSRQCYKQGPDIFRRASDKKYPYTLVLQYKHFFF